MALMHDYARPQHQASFVKFFVFTLFVRGYFLQPYCLGKKTLQHYYFKTRLGAHARLT